MWEIGSSSNNSLGHEIHVLLVDDDNGMLYSPNELLQLYSYKVTKVETAASALSLLSEGMKEFDLVLIDINIPDMDAFMLLKLVAKMDILTMLMSKIDDDATISKALKCGAFLLVRKPFTVDVVKQLRQHVIRERMNKVNKYNDETNVIVDEELNGASEYRKESKRKVGITINETRKERKAKNGVAEKGKRSGKSSKNQECNSVSENINVRNGSSKRNTCTEWTEELHQKFMDAVNQLGEGRCFPMEILETMNVPGLTRKQVASHLQKCRNDNWQAPEMRKYHHPSSVQCSNKGSQRRDSQRRFGSMPHVDQIQPNVQENISTPEITPSIGSEFTENGAMQAQQNGRVRNRFGSYPYMRNGRGLPNLNDGAPTMDNTDSELEASYIADQTNYTPGVDKTSDQATMNNQPNDDFFNYFNENMDDYFPDLTAVLEEGSLINQASASQPLLYDYSLPDQATMTNQDIGGQGNASATNYFGN